MKKAKYFALILIIAVFIFLIVLYLVPYVQSKNNMSALYPESKNIKIGNDYFRDLNKNGKLDLYEDYRQKIDTRVEDILSQMTLEEKAGMMFIPLATLERDGSISELPNLFNPLTFVYKNNSDYIIKLKINHLLIYESFPAESVAKWNNNIQKIAERTRLGIPITIGANSLNMAVKYPGSNVYMDSLSHWPFPLGLAATRDTAIVKKFGNIARQEYLAMGIRLNLNPLADLATEPRWGKINSTFGEDAKTSAQLVKAYIYGFQGNTLDKNSVACSVKHFPGGGPLKNGEDSHFPYGKTQVYPGKNFNYHLIPFEAAFEAKTSRVMPYYSIPEGITKEKTGFAFNKYIITDLLKKQLGFNGIVCTDWNLVQQQKLLGIVPLDPPKSWGVENLSDLEQAKLIIDAGCDQFGGEDSPALIKELVNRKLITEERINTSVKKLLYEKFQLGLFDNPYVDVNKVNRIIGRKDFKEAGKFAQKKSIVLLKNSVRNGRNALPLAKGKKVYVENLDKKIVSKFTTVTEKIEDADVVILNLEGPYEPRNKYLLELFYRQGNLSYSSEEESRIINIIKQKPTIICMFLDRPALIKNLVLRSDAFVAHFGVEDEALLDIIFGNFNPTGKLPFEIPSSLQSVKTQKEDLPFDSKKPLFPYGYGISFK